MKNASFELKALCSLAVLLVLVAIIGPHALPHDPYATVSGMAYQPASLEYPFGTDNLGRCLFCRVIAGLPTALISSLVVTGAAFALGTLLGIIAGFCGGVVDRVILWLVTSFQVFPSFLLAVVVAGFLGAGLANACIALVVVYWTTFARMSRSLVMSLRERPFIKAARMSGCGGFKILVRHLLPNVLPYMLVIATGDIGSVILSMSGLAYLGLGTQRPTADWGVMLSEFQGQIFVAPQLMIYVGVCLSLVVLLFTLLGDRLRDHLDQSEKACPDLGISRLSVLARLFGTKRPRNASDPSQTQTPHPAAHQTHAAPIPQAHSDETR